MLNSILSILYAILILFTSQAQGVSQKESIDFTGHWFSVDLNDEIFSDYVAEIPIVIDTKEELNEFVADFENPISENNVFGQVYDFYEGITEDYFDENILIVYVDFVGMGGMGFNVTDVISDETGTTVKYDYYAGADHATEFVSVECYELLVAEVKKSDIINTETVHFEGHEVYSAADLETP